MHIKLHNVANNKISKITSETTIINTIGDGLDLLGNLYFEGYDSVILYEKNITPTFFDLRSGMAGEILQKFSTYRIRLAIIGDYAKYDSKSLADFIYESNKGRHVNFVSTITDALNILSS